MYIQKKFGSLTAKIRGVIALNIQPDQDLFTTMHCFFFVTSYIIVNVLCSEVDAESKNVMV